MNRSRTRKALLAAGAAGAALFAADLALIAPGRERSGRWKQLSLFRYAHRGLHDQPAEASETPRRGEEPYWKREPAEGEKAVIPENSLAAFRRAAENGFGAELDVHLTRDKRLAVVHDSDLLRVTGEEGLAEKLTGPELESRRLLGTDERIPYLEEVLPIFAAFGTPLIVEIKPAGGNHAELTAAAVASLDRFSVNYCMESFDPRVLLWLRENRPDIIRGQLAMDYMKRPCGLNLPERVLLTNLFGNFVTRPNFIAYAFEDRRNPNRVLCCRLLRGHPVFWTVRSERDRKLAEKEGALVIFEKFIP